MIKLQQGKIDIHRLVQDITKLELNEQGKEEEILRTALNLFKDPIDASNSEHAASTWNHASKYKDLEKDFGALPFQIIKKVFISEEHKEALLPKSWAKTFELFDSKNNENYIPLINNIDGANIKLGKYPQAYIDIIRYFEHLDDKHNKGEASVNSSLNEKALEILNKTFEGKRIKFGEKNISTLSTQLLIVSCLSNLRKYDEALETAQFVYNTLKEVHPDHPKTLTALNYISVIYFSKSTFEEAEKAYDHIYKSRKESPDYLTLNLTPFLGIVLAEKGKYKDALEINDDFIKKQEKNLGGDHPIILGIKITKASNLIRLGRIDEAVDLLKEVIEKQENLVPNSLPKLLKTKDILAVAYTCDGKYDQAINLQKENYAARETSGGNTDISNTQNFIQLVESLKCEGQTRLHAGAILNINEEFVRELLNKGDDVNATNKKNETPLHLASKMGNTNNVITLLEKGANFEAKASGHSPVYYASGNSKETIVKILRKTSALFNDVKNNDIQKVEKDIDEGAIIHATDNDSWTVLHHAVQEGSLQIVELLLDCGADPKKEDRHGKTPLDLAKKNVTQNPTNDSYKQIRELLGNVSDK